MAARVTAGAGGGEGFRSPDDLMPDDLMLDDLMPWSVRPLRTGRAWVTSPDAASLRARWDLLVRAEGPEQEVLFRSSRSRTPRTAVAALPGQRTGTAGFARDPGPYPAPVRVQHGPFDEQWLIPDHRLLDAARPELWRVADRRQLFAVEQGHMPRDTGWPALSVTALLPDGHSPAGRPGRVRPLYRRPDGREPNLAPGLLDFLQARHGGPGTESVTPKSVLAWALAVARPSPAGCRVPLPADPALWSAGVELGRELLRLQLRGAHGGERPRLPGGRRPYVRAALPARPGGLSYDPDAEVLGLGDGRISPVPAGAWEFRVNGVRVLEHWYERRAAAAGTDGLEAVRPLGWPQEWTSELLELISLLTLLDALRPRQEALLDRLARTLTIPRDELRSAGVLPVTASARRPASVLDHHEEGPDGQFALL